MDVRTKKTMRILGVLPPPPRPKHVKPQLPTHFGYQKPFSIQTIKGDVVVLEHYKYSELLDMMYICKDPEYKGSPYTKNYRMILNELNKVLGLADDPDALKSLLQNNPYPSSQYEDRNKDNDEQVYHVKFPDHSLEWVTEDDPRIQRIRPPPVASETPVRYAESAASDYPRYYVPLRGPPNFLEETTGRWVGGKTKRKKSKSKSKKYK